MASQAIAGVGTKFNRWNGSEWAAISEITNISGPGMSRETIDVTSLDSLGGYREFIGSFRDGGTIQLTMNYTRTGLDLMQADFESADAQNYEILLPDGTSIDLVGFVQELPLTISVDSQVTMDVTIKVTGAISVDSVANSSSPA